MSTLKERPTEQKEHGDSLQEGVRKQRETVGRELATQSGQNPDEMQRAIDSEDPDQYMDALDKVLAKAGTAGESATKFWDRACAIFGITGSEAEASQRRPWETNPEAREPPPPDWKPPVVAPSAASSSEPQAETRDRTTEKPTAVSWNAWRCAEKAKDIAKRWPTYIENACRDHGFPQSFASTLAVFIKMESGGNPNAKNPSGAAGLSQAIRPTVAQYKRIRGSAFMQRTGKTTIDPFDPETGIDIMAWCLANMINTANRMVDTKGFPANYKLNGNDIEHLYMAYNNGPWGYLVLRRWLENKDRPDVAQDQKDRYYAALTKFQKHHINGVPEWQSRSQYARLVSQTQTAYALLESGTVSRDAVASRQKRTQQPRTATT